jgi:glycosyltransferase involved in cell wall biosynthesis
MMPPRRLAIVVTHPIQHFTHLYRALAQVPEIALKVFFCSRIGLEKYFDREMNTEIAWADDLTGGYDHAFLPEAERIKQSSTLGINNPSIGPALAAFKPDAVLIYGYATVTSLRALAWCRFNRVAVLMTGDGDFVRRRSVVKDAVRSVAVRTIFAQVSAFLTVGDQNEAMLEAAGVPRAKMFRSPFTIDEPAYLAARTQRQELRAKIRAEFGIDARAFVALFVGKLSGRKRPGDLLEAWVGLNGAGRAGALQIVYCGNGDQREALERRAGEGGVPAAFAGFVNVDRLPGFYCAADVLVHPSEHDPHPLICSEAAAVGLPMILSSQVGAVGPTDVARQGSNAIVVPCGDVGALGEAIAGLMADRARQAAMGLASVQVYRECDTAASVRGVVGAFAFVDQGRLRVAPGQNRGLGT